MTKWMLAAGAAALAIATPALAKPDKGGDHGNKGGGHGPSMKTQQGGKDHATRPSGPDRMQGARNDKGRDRPLVAQVKKHDRRESAGVRHSDRRVKGNDHKERRVERDVQQVFRDRNVNRVDYRQAPHQFDCPPGLARKNNGCMPPGQAKKLLGAPLAVAFANDRIPYAYRNWYLDNDRYYYRSGDGYMYRVNRGDGLVDGLMPLFGTGYYSVGDSWPDPYNFYNVPQQYQSYYSDNDDYYYRYGDGAIYRVDPTTNAVNSIVALLAGDLGVGSRLPVGYDAYNVPLSYRSQYADTPDNWYRYNDGYIYRVDPTTRLITAVIDAII
ncbi:MAG: hypothetical protein ABI667_00295 [Sphingomicrobium sp.]